MTTPNTNPVYPTTDTVKVLKDLKSMVPESGRMIQEDGTIVNYADAFVTEDGELKLYVTAD